MKLEYMIKRLSKTKARQLGVAAARNAAHKATKPRSVASPPARKRDAMHISVGCKNFKKDYRCQADI